MIILEWNVVAFKYQLANVMEFFICPLGQNKKKGVFSVIRLTLNFYPNPNVLDKFQSLIYVHFVSQIKKKSNKFRHDSEIIGNFQNGVLHAFCK